MKAASARARAKHLAPVNKPDAIIFDCDNTLLFCDMPPHDKRCTITPNTNTIKLLRMLWRQTPNSPKVLVLTGRHEHLRDLTKKQFLDHEIFCDELIMNDVVINGKKQ